MKQVRRIVRLFCTPRSSALSQADLRLRGAVLSSLAMAANKAVQIVATIVTTAMMVQYLGAESFGMTMAVAGFCQSFLFETGVSEGVKLRLIEAFSRDDRQAAQAYVSTGMLALVAVMAVIGAVFYASFPFIPWQHVFHVASPSAASELHRMVAIGVALLLAMIPLKLMREIYTANQKGYVHSFWTLAGTALSVGGVWFAISCDLGMLGVLLGMYATSVVASAACGAHLFLRDMPWLRPTPRGVRLWAWKRLWSDGSMLFLLGVALMAINGADLMLVNYCLGGAATSTYSFALRLFLYVQVIVSFVTYPAWPALAHAAQAGDCRWIRKASRTLLAGSLWFGTAACGLAVVFGRQLIGIWSGGHADVGRPLLFLLAVYIVLRIWCAVFDVLLRALGRVRLLSVATILEALLHVVLGVVLMYHMGLVGMALASVVSVLATRAWLLPTEYWHAVASLNRLSPGAAAPALPSLEEPLNVTQCSTLGVDPGDRRRAQPCAGRGRGGRQVLIR